jgi:hypothetical protein
MPTFQRMKLRQIKATFPKLAPGVACISRFLYLFDRHSVRVVGDGMCFRIRSREPLESFHAGAKHWTAWIYPDHVSVLASSTVRTAGPLGTGPVEHITRTKFDLFDFPVFLIRASQQRKRQAPIANQPVRQVSKKPACRPVAKPSSRTLPNRAPRVLTRSGTP